MPWEREVKSNMKWKQLLGTCKPNILYDINSEVHENVAEEKDIIEIDIPEAEEWIERISKTAYEMCNNNNRIKLKTESGHGPGLILKSNDSAALK